MAKTNAGAFFERKEISDEDVQKSAHFTYRDGFRLGFGIFVGLAAAGLIFLAIVWAASSLLRLF